MTPAPFLPTSREEMTALGWDAADVVFVSGDAYVDHASFAAAILVVAVVGMRKGASDEPPPAPPPPPPPEG